MKRVTLLTLIFIFILSFNAHALKEETHKTINENVAQRAVDGFYLGDYLNRQLGFKNGEKEFLAGINADGKEETMRIFEWLGSGGVQEDRPGSIMDYILNSPTRSVNHFHNPLRTWDMAGLNDSVLGNSYQGQSSVLWAQNTNQSLGGKWSWRDARQYFFIALTGTDFNQRMLADTTEERERYLADTFRAVGQLMHLVHDASVPEHVRNDAHLSKAYEGYVEDFRLKPDKYVGVWGNLIASPILFDKALLNTASPNPAAPVPIARLIDMDVYDGTNPGVTATASSASQAVGLAEYTNANFLSEDTMFESGAPHGFTYPRTADTYRWSDENNNRNYLKKVGSGDSIEHLAVTSWLYSYRIRYFPQYEQYLPVSLDPTCYKDYAQKLIPRAVGYSAGLLNYFLRGEMEVKGLPVFDQNSIDHIIIKIKNTTPTQESMGNGFFVLSYRYTPEGAPVDGSEDVWGTIPYGIANPGLPYDNEIEIVFDSFPDVIPIESYDSLKFILAFKGTLGAEDDAVVGAQFRPGEIKFNEEWDNGLKGNHNWFHMESTIFGTNPDNGSTSNVINGDVLVKDNIRFAGYESARFNTSSIGVSSLTDAFKDVFPISITPSTYVEFKIDDMTITPIPPDPPGYTSHWQMMLIYFSNNLRIQISQNGQFISSSYPTCYLTFTLDTPVVDNIYRMFQELCGMTVPEPLDLLGIEFIQQISHTPDTQQYHQNMVVDYVRIVDTEPKPQPQ